MIITISGLPGSGKSTVGKMIAKRLGYQYISMGDFRGNMALERGLTINELNKLGENEDWTDKLADEYQIKIGQTEDNLIMEGRMSWYFIPKSFKVFITVGPKEAAKRIMQNRKERKDEKPIRTLKEAEKALLERLKSDKKRYFKYYKTDYTDPKNFNLVIDSTHISAATVAKQILDKIDKLK